MTAGQKFVPSFASPFCGNVDTQFEHILMGRARMNKAEKFIEHKVCFHAWNVFCDLGCINFH